jgi:hypothetical protein
MTALWLLVLVPPLSLATGTIVANAGAILDWGTRMRSATTGSPAEWLATLPYVGTEAAEAWRVIAASPLSDLASTAAPYAASAVLCWPARCAVSAGCSCSSC